MSFALSRISAGVRPHQARVAASSTAVAAHAFVGYRTRLSLCAASQASLVIKGRPAVHAWQQVGRGARFVSGTKTTNTEHGSVKRSPQIRRETWLARWRSVPKGLRRTLVAVAVTSALLWLMCDDIEALDWFEPAGQLSLAHDDVNGGDDKMIYKGYPVIDYQPSGHMKQRLVVLGTGWGSVSVIKGLDKSTYDVCVVSPNNYFLFTPLLPSATVGTVELRSLLEPIRKITKRLRGTYIEGYGEDVDFEKKYVLIRQDTTGDKAWLPYDKLVIGVGAQSMTYGVQGLEHCHKLKTLQDVRAIRHAMLRNLEYAALPHTSDEERKRLLSFVVCGGGPTGCEFAAELYDFLSEDLYHYFPKEICDKVSVTVIQSRDHILNMFDEKLSQFAEHEFTRHNIKVITNARVARVTDTSLFYTTKNADGSIEEHEIPQGFVLWSTGVGMVPFTQQIADKLPNQRLRRCIAVDPYLRVKGVDDGSVFALGDCASVEYPHLIDHLMEFIGKTTREKPDEISFKEFKSCVNHIAHKFPPAAQHLREVHKLFEKYDVDKSKSLDKDELKAMLEDIDRKLKSLPALAQVAAQEGKYLAKLLNEVAKVEEDPNVVGEGKTVELEKLGRVKPFTYRHLGSLAYLGNSAIADFGGGSTVAVSNLVAKYLWRSVYWSEQVSIRTRILLMMDWTKELIFGRDISYF
ncbi:hypothetical protein EV182_001042 [Spiromyces aspiralis]|uniref:Uncharacterized protein n=1 Tax=Spiromyces aspiralis TaxID=68401 RepID=A0ACC1HIR8_9FUNG|nr:hypothetical protein EV182_001042 [Spiromyces aspiralis]